ncbi:DUF397 domain-containing protein [Nocardiopsis sp. MG754419]|uniref:DUF397 domain-containing protein n=1 Tax=Nocardiopsis sp. MG754419 TaxID=2259865 RepID=UPI001BA64306|nr:DUF397 domain-containing protein [Nocardiopsis sp. MG754419]MBR8745086.1 DUF397 domain-containing protein [Nocardiopsis sp. MG754419]
MKLSPASPSNWRKSSYSDRSNCVEVADMPERSAVRDTQNRSAGYLLFATGSWTEALAAVRSGA